MSWVLGSPVERLAAQSNSSEMTLYASVGVCRQEKSVSRVDRRRERGDDGRTLEDVGELVNDVRDRREVGRAAKDHQSIVSRCFNEKVCE